MITKINSISFTRNNQTQQTNSTKRTFGSSEVAKTFYEIKPNEIRIGNILDLNNGLHVITKDKLPEGAAKVAFANGDKMLVFTKKNDNSKTLIRISAITKSDEERTIAKISVKNKKLAPSQRTSLKFVLPPYFIDHSHNLPYRVHLINTPVL